MTENEIRFRELISKKDWKILKHHLNESDPFILRRLLKNSRKRMV